MIAAKIPQAARLFFPGVKERPTVPIGIGIMTKEKKPGHEELQCIARIAPKNNNRKSCLEINQNCQLNCHLKRHLKRHLQNENHKMLSRNLSYDKITSLQLQMDIKKKTLANPLSARVFVESGRIELPSKQAIKELSTRLFPDWFFVTSLGQKQPRSSYLL